MTDRPSIAVNHPPRSVSRADRVVFAPSVEALLVRGIGDKLTPELIAKLKAMGFDLTKPLLPGYPSQQWQEAISLVARELYPELSMADAQWKLGESTVLGFEGTLIGKAMVALSKLIGPRRALLRFPSMSRTSNNFAQMTAEELGPTEIKFAMEPYEGLPAFVLGCISAIIVMTGGKDPKVEVVSEDPATERVTIRASWRGGS